MNAKEARELYSSAVDNWLEKNRIEWQNVRKDIDHQIAKACTEMETSIRLSRYMTSVLSKYKLAIPELISDGFSVRMYHQDEIVNRLEFADKVVISW